MTKNTDVPRRADHNLENTKAIMKLGTLRMSLIVCIAVLGLSACSGSNPLIGHWKLVSSSGGAFGVGSMISQMGFGGIGPTVEFASDHIQTASMELPIQRYSVNGNIVTVWFGNKNAEVGMTFHVSNDGKTMTMTDQSGIVYTYEKQ